MALSKNSRGNLTGWIAAGLLALAVFSAQLGGDGIESDGGDASVERATEAVDR